MEKSIKISTILTLPNGGSFGICQCPGKNLPKGRDGKEHKRSIESDLIDFQSRGVSLIICLLNDSELRSIGVSPSVYKSSSLSLSINFIQHPVLEMAAPSDASLFEAEVITPAFVSITEGRFVIAHCRGGIGRAGTLAACMLKRFNLAPTFIKAIALVRKVRDKRCVESRKQEDFIKKYFESNI